MYKMYLHCVQLHCLLLSIEYILNSNLIIVWKFFTKIWKRELINYENEVYGDSLDDVKFKGHT